MVLVADLLVCSNGSFHWNICFLRAALDWEMGMLAHFFDSLYAMSFGNVLEDRMTWNSGGNKRFLVCSFIRPHQNYLMIIAFLGSGYMGL